MLACSFQKPKGKHSKRAGCWLYSRAMSSEAILKPELYNGLAIMLDVRLFSIKK
jgi:hypothetical protein